MSSQPAAVEVINSLSESELQEALIKCSGSPVWCKRMIGQRPYQDRGDFIEKGRRCFDDLSREDWLVAFSSHPKIGDIENLRKKFASTAAWASNEQSGVNSASEETLARLARGNADYETRFGHIFIVCATGKTAQQMLELLEQRLNNTAEIEFPIACEEHKKITQLRMEKLEV